MRAICMLSAIVFTGLAGCAHSTPGKVVGGVAEFVFDTAEGNDYVRNCMLEDKLQTEQTCQQQYRKIRTQGEAAYDAYHRVDRKSDSDELSEDLDAYMKKRSEALPPQ